MVPREKTHQRFAHITTTEAVILNLLGDKNHPSFRQVQQIIRELNPWNKSLL